MPKIVLSGAQLTEALCEALETGLPSSLLGKVATALNVAGERAAASTPGDSIFAPYFLHCASTLREMARLGREQETEIAGSSDKPTPHTR